MFRRLTSASAAVALSSLVALPSAAQDAARSAGGSAFQKRVVFTIPDGSTSMCEAVAVVPPNRRLVIEYASATVQPVPGQDVAGQVRTQVGTDLVFHALTFTRTPSGARAVAGQIVRLYADPGTAVSICIDRSPGAGDVGVIANVSGRLVR